MLVALISSLTVLVTGSLILTEVRRDDATVMGEKVVPIIDARSRTVLLLVERLDNTVTYFSIVVL